MSAPLAGFPPLPFGQFGAVIADPPWLFRNRSPKGEAKNACRKYRCLPTPVIAALGRDLVFSVGPDCALFMWVTGPMLLDGIAVMRAWGFTFKTVAFVWEKRSSTGRKRHFGQGYWTRQDAEVVLLGTVGAPRRLSRSVRQTIEAPMREHSRKPDELYERVVRLVGGPYLELFARQTWPGWTSWGEEVGRFEPALKVAA